MSFNYLVCLIKDRKSVWWVMCVFGVEYVMFRLTRVITGKRGGVDEKIREVGWQS